MASSLRASILRAAGGVAVRIFAFSKHQAFAGGDADGEAWYIPVATLPPVGRDRNVATPASTLTERRYMAFTLA